jgi:hypothetical protein
VVVTVAVVPVVEMTIDHVIGVIAVRYRGVPAVRRMNVRGVVAGAAMTPVARLGVRRVNRDRTLLSSRRMEVSIV